MFYEKLWIYGLEHKKASIYHCSVNFKLRLTKFYLLLNVPATEK